MTAPSQADHAPHNRVHSEAGEAALNRKIDIGHSPDTESGLRITTWGTLATAAWLAPIAFMGGGAVVGLWLLGGSLAFVLLVYAIFIPQNIHLYVWEEHLCVRRSWGMLWFVRAVPLVDIVAVEVKPYAHAVYVRTKGGETHYVSSDDFELNDEIPVPAEYPPYSIPRRQQDLRLRDYLISLADEAKAKPVMSWGSR